MWAILSKLLNWVTAETEVILSQAPDRNQFDSSISGLLLVGEKNGQFVGKGLIEWHKTTPSRDHIGATAAAVSVGRKINLLPAP